MKASGGTVKLRSSVVTIERGSHGAKAVVYENDGQKVRIEADHVISSMPFSELAHSLDPLPPPEVFAAADDLHYRDFLTIALVVPESASFPDNWIYVHDPNVKVGRVQNFARWSPFLVKDGRTCLGLEYWVTEGDDNLGIGHPVLEPQSRTTVLHEEGRPTSEFSGPAPPSRSGRGHISNCPESSPIPARRTRSSTNL